MTAGECFNRQIHASACDSVPYSGYNLRVQSVHLDENSMRYASGCLTGNAIKRGAAEILNWLRCAE
jgi:hypothetical protein